MNEPTTPANEADLALPERLEAVRERIAGAVAKRRAKNPRAQSPRLIAVSKRQPLSAITRAVALGLRDFGENYAQEFRDKLGQMAPTAPADLRWHFTGQLQRNKVKHVVGHALIHTVDRPELVDALERRAAANGLTQALLVEVNSGEAAKGGVSPDKLGALLDHIAQASHLRCDGLMTMAPIGPPARAREAFEALAHQRQTQADRLGQPLPELSMGMSGDFEIAIEAGATLVRVGSAIFGPRESR